MHWGSYYIFWLAAPLVLSLVAHHPGILIVAVVALVARRWIPDPFLFFKYSGRIATLRRQIDVNPHDVTAQRELALIYLEKRRPGKAIVLLDRALEREPDSPELLYQSGRALLGARRWQEALDRIVAAVARDPRLSYGDPYARAGDALIKLGRLEDAEEAFQRAAAINASNVEARTKLGLVRAARRDAAGAKAAFDDARATYRQLPGFGKRKTWWWAFRAWMSG